MLARLLFVLTALVCAKCHFKLSNYKLSMAVDEITSLQLNAITDKKNMNVTISFEPLDNNILQIIPSSIQANSNFTYDVKVRALKAGLSHVHVATTSVDNITICAENGFLLVKVYKSLITEWVSSCIGWLYFSAWSISFYPQIYTNYKRKSVVGLNFDYLFFNIVGYIMYSAFNMGIYFVPTVKEQYSFRHPGSINPVQPNDIFFSTHGLIATSGTIFQCFIYEKGNQNISVITKIIVGLYFFVITTSIVLARVGTVIWLDVLYVCSYIKLCVTITKYMPQVYMNHKRKSTHGWSIYAVLLDFSGGILSILQMILNGYNYDDWTIIIENPTKFGLGILTIGFDLVFAFQHYFLYTAIKNTTAMSVKMNTI